ncbi:MAG: PQQ-binding-like beta-propeller repeat protein [Verrucomicrobiales bacterium]|nr:PQQ-binding-like beta-propeller repeat protein [Verrucomicrobiales bacterium]
MSGNLPNPEPPILRRRIRWWPAVLVFVATGVAVAVIRGRSDLPFQSRNLNSMVAVILGVAGLWLWWLLASRAAWRWRFAVCGGALVVVGLLAATFRIRGVSGDLLPILEPRWTREPVSNVERVVSPTDETLPPASDRPDFPQFLGPNRNCVIEGVTLDPDWTAHPPVVLWRQPIGAAWSGFAVVGNRAVTQEQRGEEELVTCYDVATGRRLWGHADPARFDTTIAGVGPRATPTIVSNRVFTLGATGWLNCLELENGKSVWQRQITGDAESKAPGWGFAGSPLWLDRRIIVSAGGRQDHSLLAYDAATGEMVWHGGSDSAGYSSPFVAELDGTTQILSFNGPGIAAHAPEDGRVLWQYPWGRGQPHVAEPVIVGPDRVVFSSGYGVGAELLQVRPDAQGEWQVESLWQSRALKAKFANFIAKEGYLYGLDDGILACVDLADGRRVWKEGRYGHGQMLRVGEHVLLTAENGELILLAPTPEGPNERQRFKVFSDKTWNPPALSGDLLLLRNDQEAACVRVALAGA